MHAAGVWQDEETGEIAFYMKGADIVMHNVVEYNDWMDEEVKLVLCCCLLVMLRYHGHRGWNLSKIISLLPVVNLGVFALCRPQHHRFTPKLKFCPE